MTNHYHLLLETVEGNLSRGIRQLNGLYTQRFNHHHRMVGHLFQGRYKAILVQKDTYLLELTRYVALNPLRANMVTALEDWAWSSYPAIAKSSPDTALRDISDLLARGVLRKSAAQGRSTSYDLQI